MIIKRQIGEKGQVVIPRDIRKMLNLHKGSEVVFQVENNKVELKPEEDPEKFIEEFLNIPKIKRKISVKEMKKIISEESERYDKVY